MSAGRGIQHSEYNQGTATPVRMLQIWLLPELRGTQPGYAQRHFAETGRRGRLQLLVNPDGSDGAVVLPDGALWTGGAEAMTIQSQRVTSRTGVKCVGNSVVLHGVPYAPPYEIAAIGDPERLERGLADSTAVQIYREYVTAYGLGYAQRREASVTMPAYRGSLDIQAKRVG